MQHLKRALYQAIYCCGQSLVTNQEPPDACLWGWKNTKNGFEVQWMMLSESSEVFINLLVMVAKKREAVKDVANAKSDIKMHSLL